MSRVAALLLVLSGWELAGAEPQLTTPAGRARVAIQAQANASEGQLFKPTSLALDLDVGVAQGISVGLHSSTSAITGLIADLPVDGLCVYDDASCPELFTGAALDARFDILRGDVSLAVEVGGVYARRFGNPEYKVKAGVLSRFGSKKFSVILHPTFYVGLNKRGQNAESLILPLTLWASPLPSLGFGLQGAVQIGDFRVIGERWRIPLAAVAAVTLGKRMQLWGSFGFPYIASGSQLPGGIDLRAINIGVALTI